MTSSKILTYEEINRDEWLKLVRNSSTGTWFQSPDAYAFYASQSDLLIPFAFASETDGKLSAVCVGYTTKSPNLTKHFFTRRSIISGGICVADDCAKSDVLNLLAFVRAFLSKQSIYIETRNFNDFTPWREAFEQAGFLYQPHLNFHVDCTQDLTNRLSENRKRQLKRSVASIEEAKGEIDIREWYAILHDLYRTKVKTPLWPMEFFIEAYRQKIGKFLLVKHEGKIIGGSMIVADERCVYEWYECGLNAQYRDLYPSVKATYAGMEYAKKQGRVRYDMMGAGEPNVPYGVRDFKAEFGGVLVEHGRFLHISKPLLYKIGALGVKFLKR